MERQIDRHIDRWTDRFTGRQTDGHKKVWMAAPYVLPHVTTFNFHNSKTISFCQPQAKAEAKAMPGRLYIHTINKTSTDSVQTLAITMF